MRPDTIVTNYEQYVRANHAIADADVQMLREDRALPRGEREFRDHVKKIRDIEYATQSRDLTAWQQMRAALRGHRELAVRRAYRNHVDPTATQPRSMVEMERRHALMSVLDRLPPGAEARDRAHELMQYAAVMGDENMMRMLSLVAEQRMQQLGESANDDQGWNRIHQMWADNSTHARKLLEPIGHADHMLAETTQPDRYQAGDLTPPAGLPRKQPAEPNLASLILPEPASVPVNGDGGDTA
jgi:hypothetical protein